MSADFLNTYWGGLNLKGWQGSSALSQMNILPIIGDYPAQIQLQGFSTTFQLAGRFGNERFSRLGTKS
jgi:hypothetical protein